MDEALLGSKVAEKSKHMGSVSKSLVNIQSQRNARHCGPNKRDHHCQQLKERAQARQIQNEY